MYLCTVISCHFTHFYYYYCYYSLLIPFNVSIRELNEGEQKNKNKKETKLLYATVLYTHRDQMRAKPLTSQLTSIILFYVYFQFFLWFCFFFFLLFGSLLIPLLEWWIFVFIYLSAYHSVLFGCQKQNINNKKMKRKEKKKKKENNKTRILLQSIHFSSVLF